MGRMAWARGDSGKWTKPPLQARFPHRRAKNNDPATWSSHAEAAHAVQEGLGHGIGFVLTDTEIAAIDLDHCRDPETGAIAPLGTGHHRSGFRCVYRSHGKR